MLLASPIAKSSGLGSPGVADTPRRRPARGAGSALLGGTAPNQSQRTLKLRRATLGAGSAIGVTVVAALVIRGRSGRSGMPLPTSQHLPGRAMMPAVTHLQAAAVRNASYFATTSSWSVLRFSRVFESTVPWAICARAMST